MIRSFVFYLFSVSAFAQIAVGNGNTVVICPDDSKIGFTAEAYDLYEGEVTYNLTFNYVRTLPYDQLNSYVNKQILNRQTKANIKAFESLESENSDTFTEDLAKELNAGKIRLNPGCKIQKFNTTLVPGFFNYQNEFLIMQKHEVLYSMARRKFKDDSSVRARKFLAFALSDQVRKKDKYRFDVSLEQEYLRLLIDWWK